MTEDEMRALMGDTVAGLASLKKTRTCLHAKRDKYRDHLNQALRVVMGGSDDILKDDGWPTAEDIRTLRADLADTSEKIEGLETRLKEWGALDR